MSRQRAAEAERGGARSATRRQSEAAAARRTPASESRRGQQAAAAAAACWRRRRRRGCGPGGCAGCRSCWRWAWGAAAAAAAAAGAAGGAASSRLKVGAGEVSSSLREAGRAYRCLRGDPGPRFARPPLPHLPGLCALGIPEVSALRPGP